ncbi:uncharacterized protein TNCV_3026001 [Trichonephila clavipes]|nr:uncharacterized protein TNCV_3026001 [Trichonephila clavipes]
MKGFTYAVNADMHYMYGHVNDNSRAALRMYHTQFPDRRMPDHRIFQGLHRQLREISSFHITTRDACQQRPVRSSSLEESIVSLVATRPKSSTRAVANLISDFGKNFNIMVMRVDVTALIAPELQCRMKACIWQLLPKETDRAHHQTRLVSSLQPLVRQFQGRPCTDT